MTIDERYMYRCLQLASNGRGYVGSNPMVGAAVVYEGKIIGEGYHRVYGQAHAEVNAIDAVKDKSLLKQATIYVSLEPCSHYGKTPPCSQLIIDSGIRHVVVACRDPFPAVSGRGIEMLKEAGVKITEGVLEKEALLLNKEFIVAQTQNRPYVYLKWAQSADGYIDKIRTENDGLLPTMISTDFTQMLVHKKRAEVASIMVGTNTAVKDNPTLTTRLWYGQHPVRITIDRQNRIPTDSKLFDGAVPTIVFTEKAIYENPINSVSFEEVKFDDTLVQQIFSKLKARNINSILVEGGSQLLQTLIDSGFWDEAYVEVSDQYFDDGIAAPHISKEWLVDCPKWGVSKQLHYCRS